MVKEEIGILHSLGAAIWALPQVAEPVTREAVVASALLPPEKGESMDLAVRAMLTQARRQGASTAGSLLMHPFFRLSLEARFALSLLHRAHWSYPRLARLLNLDVIELQQLAWTARLALAFSPEVGQARKTRIEHPSAAAAGPTCPEYDPSAPWTQRFMDDELPPRERGFLSNHLMACAGCRRGLSQARELYYAIEAWIPDRASPEAVALTESGVREAVRWTRRKDAPVRDSLPAFLLRPKNLAVLSLPFLYLLLKSL